MDRLVVDRLAAGVDRASIVHELSLNFDYVQCALRAYVDGFQGADKQLVGAELAPAEDAPMRSFRLSR